MDDAVKSDYKDLTQKIMQSPIKYIPIM